LTSDKMSELLPMIQTKVLTKRFGNFTAVNNLNLNIAQGEIFGFLGANGAGKTTAIKMLCGLLKPTSGKAIVAECDISTQSELLKQRIGYMSQRFALYEDLTVKENVLFYSGIYGVKKDKALSIAETMLSELGINISDKSLTGSLPLGFKQRLALTCSLLHEPRLLFLDEPTSGVDPQARRAFWKVINNLAEQGKTIIVTTHFMDEAEYCHRVLIMQNGEAIANGKPNELQAQYQVPNMQALFLKLVS
jgi:ABC-2 type transport system ATP-binding protein